MDNEITPKQGEEAYGLHQNVLTLKRQIGIAFITIGRILKEIKDNKYYVVLGYDSFVSYVQNSELGFKYRTAYYYIEVFEWFVEKLSYDEKFIAEVGYDKLLRLLPVIKKASSTLSYPMLKTRSDNLLNEVQELRPVDFNKKYKDDKANEEHEDYLAPPEYFRCSCHGKWRIVVPVEDCCPDFLKDFNRRLNEGKKSANS